MKRGARSGRLRLRAAGAALLAGVTALVAAGGLVAGAGASPVGAGALLAGASTSPVGAGALGAAAGSPTAPAGRMIVCPLGSAGPSQPPPCCGPLAAMPRAARRHVVCCPPNAICAQPLTISARPDPSVAGERVRIAGRAPASMAGQRVVLWQRPATARAFTAVARTSIRSDGSYSFGSPRVAENVLWYATAGEMRSATVVQRVRVRIVERDVASCTRRWLALSGRGSVFPAQPGGHLRLLARRAHGRWRQVALLRLVDGVRFSIRYRRRAPASVALRLYFAGDRRNAAGYSPAATVACR